MRNPEANPLTDVVPAMLTPGEAVIPAPAAQHPVFKPIINKMVQAGRQMNEELGLSGQGKSKKSIWDLQGYSDGTPFVAGDRDSFKEFMLPLVEKQAKERGINPNVIINQLGLETGWGKSIIGNNNFGNIKDFSNRPDSVQAFDKTEKSNDKYRSYGSPQEFLDDYWKTISKWDVNGAQTNEDFARRLTTGKLKYATDPDYVKKMSRFDNEAAPLARGALPTDATGRHILRQQALAAKNSAESERKDAGNMPPLQQRQNASALMNNRRITAELHPELVTEPGLIDPENDVRVPNFAQSSVEGGRGNINPPLVNPKPYEVPPKDEAVPEPQQEVAPPQEVITNEQIYQGLTDPDRFKKAMESFEMQSFGVDLENLFTEMKQQDAPKEQIQKSLADRIAAAFKGMFNDEDLMRFAILTAGGLITGGSLAGSIRYAGLNVIQHSDVRRREEAAATATAARDKKNAAQREYEYLRGRRDKLIDENRAWERDGFKNGREYAEQRLRDISSDLPHIPPEMRSQVIEQTRALENIQDPILRAKVANDLALQVSALRTKDITGLTSELFFDKQGNTYWARTDKATGQVIDNNTNKPLDRRQLHTPAEERQLNEDFRKMVSTRVKPTIMQHMRMTDSKAPSGEADATADKVAAGIVAMTKRHKITDPEAVSQLVGNGVERIYGKMLREKQPLTEAGLIAGLEANFLYALAPSMKLGEEYLPPIDKLSVKDMVALGDKYKSVSDKMSPTQFLAGMKEEFLKLSEEERRKFIVEAKKDNTTPFLKYVISFK